MICGLTEVDEMKSGKERCVMSLKDLVPAMWGAKNVQVRQEDDHPFYSLQRDMNRIFDDFFKGFETIPAGMLEGHLGAFSPTVDMKEGEKELTIKAELPGMDEKDIEVSLADDTLTIQGEKKEEKEEKGKGYYHAERSFGSFRRVLPLPAGIDTRKAEASFKKGVLTITVPKTEEAKRKVKKIEIKTE
jgi:HSP20 family protein